MKGFSVIISAYNVAEFIEECLDSILNQTSEMPIEILVGVDNCESTLEKLKKIKHKYSNIRIFMNKKNVGTYITKNSLLKYANYSHIIQFDSDDVMDVNLIKECEPYIDRFDVIKFKGYDFLNNKKNRVSRIKEMVCPAIYKREVFDKFGGYQPWRIVADSEFKKRTRNFLTKFCSNKVLMYRRLHPNSLTRAEGTKHKSEFRKAHFRLIKPYYNKMEKIRLVTTECYKI